jgi:Zn finger protein HypA/HybF involved in hydrogenase expression
MKCKCFNCNYITEGISLEEIKTNIHNDGGEFKPEQEYTECPNCHDDSLEIV